MSNADYDRWFNCLNNIKPIQFLPRLNAMTIPLAAEYFGVNSHRLNRWCGNGKRNLALMNLGMRRLNAEDVMAAGYEVAIANPIAACQLDDVRFTMCSLNPGSYFLTRNCLCYIAFNLYWSDVAKVFRSAIDMDENKDNDKEKRKTKMVYGEDRVGAVQQDELMELTNGADIRLRVADMDDDRSEPWFIAIDACKALNITNSTSALRRIPNGTLKRIYVFHTNGCNSTMNVINYEGFLSLINSAKRADPEVVRWINDTVFPAVGLKTDETLPALIVTDNADKENSEDVLVVTPDAITNASDDIRVFNNSEYGELRTMIIDGEPWFVAVDVCRALEIRNNRDAMERLDADEKGVALTDTPGGKQEMSIVNEPGLYSLVLGSRKPEAKAFKRWITHDVIPSLRKHGAYIIGQETMTETELIAKALIASHRIAEEREAQLKQAKAELKQKEEEVASLQTEKIALIGEVQTWDYRSIINALMRKYAAETNKLHSSVYNELYRQINYKLHINLKSRMPVKNQKSNLARAREKELPDITKIAVAMCEEIGMDIPRVINEVNAERQLSPV